LKAFTAVCLPYVKNASRCGYRGRDYLVKRHMKPLLCTLILAVSISAAQSSVVLTAGATAPVPGINDQYSFVNDAVISGGNYPYNISAYSDRTPGQSFTTPSGSGYQLTSFSLLGSGDADGLDEATWTIQVGTVSLAGSTVTFTPLLTVNNVATPVSMASTDWLTWTFTGADVLTLDPNTMYGIQVVNSAGYMGFAASTSSSSYAGGYAFAASQPGWSEYPNPVDFGYDRTFVVGLSAVPEPASSLLLLGGLGLLTWRTRKNR